MCREKYAANIIINSIIDLFMRTIFFIYFYMLNVVNHEYKACKQGTQSNVICFTQW